MDSNVAMKINVRLKAVFKFVLAIPYLYAVGRFMLWSSLKAQYVQIFVAILAYILIFLVTQWIFELFVGSKFLKWLKECLKKSKLRFALLTICFFVINTIIFILIGAFLVIPHIQMLK